jgi:hypothetical protein
MERKMGTLSGPCGRLESVNLTDTPDADEMYPMPRPWTKVCFVADEGAGRDKMPTSTTESGRDRPGEGCRERQTACWSLKPDDCLLKAEYRRYTITD